MQCEYNKKITKEDHKMPTDEYMENVNCGGIIDDDGHGHPYKGNMYSWDIFIHPSEHGNDIPEDADGVVWFNR